MKKFNEFDLGEKIVIISSIIGVISLFMPWVDMGFAKTSGFQQQGFIFLIFFIYPVYKILKGEKYNKIIGITLGILSIVLSIMYNKSKTVDFFGETANFSGTGMYIFIFAAIGFTIGNALVKGTIKKEELNQDIDEVKSYVKKAGDKIGEEVSKLKEEQNTKEEDKIEKDNLNENKQEKDNSDE